MHKLLTDQQFHILATILLSCVAEESTEVLYEMEQLKDDESRINEVVKELFDLRLADKCIQTLITDKYPYVNTARLCAIDDIESEIGVISLLGSLSELRTLLMHFIKVANKGIRFGMSYSKFKDKAHDEKANFQIIDTYTALIEMVGISVAVFINNSNNVTLTESEIKVYKADKIERFFNNLKLSVTLYNEFSESTDEKHGDIGDEIMDVIDAMKKICKESLLP